MTDTTDDSGENAPETPGQAAGETRCGFVAVLGAPNAGK